MTDSPNDSGVIPFPELDPSDTEIREGDPDAGPVFEVEVKNTFEQRALLEAATALAKALEAASLRVSQVSAEVAAANGYDIDTDKEIAVLMGPDPVTLVPRVGVFRIEDLAAKEARFASAGGAAI